MVAFSLTYRGENEFDLRIESPDLPEERNPSQSCFGGRKAADGFIILFKSGQKIYNNCEYLLLDRVVNSHAIGSRSGSNSCQSVESNRS